MNNPSSRELIPVAKGSLLSLGEGKQVQIGCESGSVWITQDNDPRDVVLGAGETFVSDRPGTVLVYALQPAVLSANSLVERTQGSFWTFVAAKLRPANTTRGLALTSAADLRPSASVRRTLRGRSDGAVTRAGRS